MIITLINADFSQSNIGTLSTWRISRSLGVGATYEGPTSVDKNAALNVTITIAEGYEIGAAGVTITMGGVILSGAYTIEGNVITITIGEVTGNVLIKVPTVNTATGEEEEPEIPDVPEISVEPIVNLTLTNVTDGILRNVGVGGSAYNGTITTPNSGDSYVSDGSGLSLIGHAYANVPYGFKATDKFTIVVRGCLSEMSGNKYERLYRTDIDAPSIYYSQSAKSYGSKLAGVSGNGNTTHQSYVTFQSGVNSAYITENKANPTEMNTFVHVGDGSKIYLYVNGVLAASQNASPLATSTLIGVGDNDIAKTYNANKTSIAMFRIYNYAMTAEEVAAII